MGSWEQYHMACGIVCYIMALTLEALILTSAFPNLFSFVEKKLKLYLVFLVRERPLNLNTHSLTGLSCSITCYFVKLK